MVHYMNKPHYVVYSDNPAVVSEHFSELRRAIDSAEKRSEINASSFYVGEVRPIRKYQRMAVEVELDS
jgi:hypothetical protein